MFLLNCLISLYSKKMTCTRIYYLIDVVVVFVDKLFIFIINVIVERTSVCPIRQVMRFDSYCFPNCEFVNITDSYEYCNTKETRIQALYLRLPNSRAKNIKLIQWDDAKTNFFIPFTWSRNKIISFGKSQNYQLRTGVWKLKYRFQVYIATA